MAGGKVKEYQFNTEGGVSSAVFINTPTASSGSVAWGDVTGTLANQSDLQTALNARQVSSAKGQINGYAGLDAAGLVPVAQLPGLPAAWGAITGVLATQTDLQDVLNTISTKAASATLSSAAFMLSTMFAISTHNISSATHTFPGGTNVYLRGDGTFATPAGGSSNLSTVRVTSLKTTTTTSTQTIPELTFDVSANSTYAFEFGIVYASAVATTALRAGLRFVTMSTMTACVDIPVAAAGTGAMFHGWINASTLNHQSTFTASTVVGATTPLASTKYMASVYGSCVPAASGTLAVTYATEVAGSAISTFVGSYGILTTL